MPNKPVSFQNGDLKVIAAGDLDPSVLPPSIVTTDGTHPFTAPQTGVAPSADTHLTTQGAVKGQLTSLVWQGSVVSATTTAQPGSPTGGDRYVLPVAATGAAWAGQDKKLAEWNGTVWTFTAPAAGWTVYAKDIDIYVQYSQTLGTWGDISRAISHEAAKNLQGGTTGEHYHLTAIEHGVFSGSKGSRQAVIAPNGGGQLAVRALDAADIQAGQLTAARGGLGTDASAASGYPKATAGAFSFSATIPYGDLTGTPSTLPPAGHHVTHELGGSDQLALSATQITSGLVPRNRGGLGVDSTTVQARKAWIAPTADGAPTYRLLTPDDISGASAAFQVLMRNSGNTANVWQIVDTTSLGAVPTSREVQTVGYLTGGGALSADLTLGWLGLDVQANGSSIARRPILNIAGPKVTAVDNPGSNRVDITVANPVMTDLVGGNYKVFYTDGTGAVRELALGTTGQVLTSQGPSATPTFTTPASGGGGAVASVNTRTGAVVLGGTDIPAFVASGGSHAPGAVPDPGSSAGTSRFLREDATWASPGGGVASVNTRTGVITLVGTDIPAFVASGGGHAAGAVPDPGSSAGTTRFLREDATWASPGGEANTASNGGTAGVGLFYQKSGVDLQFKALKAGSSKVTVTDSTGDHTVAVDIIPANLGLVRDVQYWTLVSETLGHSHVVELSQVEVDGIVAGTPLTKTSTVSGHSHDVTFGLVNGRIVPTTQTSAGTGPHVHKTRNSYVFGGAFEFLYYADGGNGHTHFVSVTESDLDTLLSGGSVTKTSGAPSSGSFHSHDVTLSVAAGVIVTSTPSAAGTNGLTHTHPVNLVDQASVGSGANGAILQTTSVSDTTDRTTASTTYADTTVSAVLPANLNNSANKVRIRVSATVSADSATKVYFTLKRDTTDLTPSGRDAIAIVAVPATDALQQIDFEFDDTPGSTTPATYHLLWKVSAGTGYLNSANGTDLGQTMVVLEEIDPSASGGGVRSLNTRVGNVTLVGTDIPTFVASGGSHAAGAVPDPGASAGSAKFLREDATWALPPVTSVNTRTGAITLTGTDIPAFVGSGVSHAPGAVPDPGASAGTSRFLCENGTWASPGGGVTSVNTRTGVITLVGTDIPTFVASGGSHAAGAVPDPGSSAGSTKFLREDATWALPPVTSVNTRTGAITLTGADIPVFVASGVSHAAGAVPDPGSSVGTTRFLREDASWATPPVTSVNTRTGAIILTGTDIPAFVASGGSHAAGAVPDPGASAGTTRFLREDATWATPAGAGGVTSVNTRTGAVTLTGSDIPAFVASGGSHAPGAVPDPGSSAGTTRFLCENGTWATPSGTGGGGGSPTGNVIGTVGWNVSGGTVSGTVADGVVSGVTRLATGKYQVNFTTAQPDNNYIVTIQCNDDNAYEMTSYLSGTTTSYTTTSFIFVSYSFNGSAVHDCSFYRVAVMRTGSGSGLSANTHANYKSTILAESSLVGFWGLDEANGSSTCADGKGSNTLTATGTPYLGTPSRFADTTAAFFNGNVSAYLTKTSPTGLPSGAAARSVELWYRGVNISATTQVLMQYGTASSGQQYLLRVDSGGGKFYADYNVINDTPTEAMVDDGQWHHLVTTYDGSVTTKVYVDGVLIKTTTLGGAINTTVANLFIGSGNGSAPVVGLLSDVAIYNTALTQTAIQAHFSVGRIAGNGGGTVSSSWTSETTTITGTTTNPTKGTVVNDNVRYRRVGDSMEVNLNYRQSAGGSAGSGTYLFRVPAGASIDTSKLPVNASPDTTFDGTCGYGLVSDLSTFTYQVVVMAYDATHVAVNAINQGVVGSSKAPLSSVVQYQFSLLLPIAGWT